LKKIFICSNVNQLISFYFLYNYKNTDIYVFVINSYANKNILINKIRKFSNKFGFNFVEKKLYENFLKKEIKVDLISRNPLNHEEINFVNNFKINKWIILEDGIGDYILKYRGLDIRIYLYFIIKFYELLMSKSRLLFNLIFRNKKRFFYCKSKLYLPLLYSSKSLQKKNFNILKSKFDPKKKYKIIIIGSIYNFNLKGPFYIYDYISKEINKKNINLDEILYIPHPRLKNGHLIKIKSRYKWKILMADLIAEEIIFSNPKADIYSIGSTAILLANSYKYSKCKIFFHSDYLSYKSLLTFIKMYSLSVFYKSLGIELLKIE
jgi:hypothetical protein